MSALSPGWNVTVMLLDFDPDVVAVSSQPFWRRWAGQPRARRHVPDFFARLADGSAVVIDVRPDDLIGAGDAEVFAATRRACAAVGWGTGVSGWPVRCWRRTCAGCRGSGIAAAGTRRWAASWCGAWRPGR
jgi:hypothetical protein